MPAIDDERTVQGADPCRLPSGDQLRDLGLDATGIAGQAAEGPRCEWRDGRGTVLGFTLFVGGDGLTTLARNSEPTTSRVRIDGYPALETFTGRGEFCQYDVGISPTQVLMASLETPASDSCSALQTVLPQILRNLPPAAR